MCCYLLGLIFVIHILGVGLSWNCCPKFWAIFMDHSKVELLLQNQWKWLRSFWRFWKLSLVCNWYMLHARWGTRLNSCWICSHQPDFRGSRRFGGSHLFENSSGVLVAFCDHRGDLVLWKSGLLPHIPHHWAVYWKHRWARRNGKCRGWCHMGITKRKVLLKKF